jgi:hypothetical protein
VSDELRHAGHRVTPPGLIDMTVPNAARAADFLDGGKDNFAADRKAAAALVESAPSIAAVPAAAKAFRRRVVTHLAAEAGVRQFLDVGDGLVVLGRTHEIAQAVDPGARVVYVESDPMMLDQTRARVASAPGGLVASVDGDIADVEGIVAAAGLTGRPGRSALPSAGGDGAILDVGQPVAVLLMSTLAHVPSEADAAKVVAGLMNSVPSGSYVAVYHLASDLDPALATALKRWNAGGSVPIALRSSAEVGALVAGLDVAPPGVVPIDDWRPDGTDRPDGPTVPIHGVLARKP